MKENNLRYLWSVAVLDQYDIETYHVLDASSFNEIIVLYGEDAKRVNGYHPDEPTKVPHTVNIEIPRHIFTAYRNHKPDHSYNGKVWFMRHNTNDIIPAFSCMIITSNESSAIEKFKQIYEIEPSDYMYIGDTSISMYGIISEYEIPDTSISIESELFNVTFNNMINKLIEK